MMAMDEPSSIQTRPSLLNRLKEGNDSESWQEFYRIYGKLVRDFAIKAGLTDTEADEVVQETAIAMARHLLEYRYDPKVCRFKTWLLNQASWRIQDQIKKRNREMGRRAAAGGSDETGSTTTVHRIPDPASVDLDALFENEWQRNLMDAAMHIVREKFTPKQFQIFDLLAVQEWPAGEVAKNLGVTLANVYVTRHRVAAAVKKEVKSLEQRLEQAAAKPEAPAQPPTKPSGQA